LQLTELRLAEWSPPTASDEFQYDGLAAKVRQLE
jgi:hypothetical protein